MRSNKWDNLPSTINDFKNKMQVHKSALETIIQKSDMQDQESLNTAIIAFDDVKDVAGSIYDQFIALRNDYNTDRINLAKYRYSLKQLSDLLTDTDEKLKIDELHTDEIAKECKLHFN